MKDLMLIRSFERKLNRVRFRSRRYITLFSISLGRSFKENFFIYHQYLALLCYLKWYKRIFYTLKKHCNSHSRLKFF